MAEKILVKLEFTCYEYGKKKEILNQIQSDSLWFGFTLNIIE